MQELPRYRCLGQKPLEILYIYIYMYNAFNALEVHYSTRSRGKREGRGGSGGEGESGERRERRGGGHATQRQLN